MDVICSRFVVWALCGALLCASGAQAQGQSPTSPRPRPGIPDSDAAPGPNTNNNNGGPSSRFSGESSRFSRFDRDAKPPEEAREPEPPRSRSSVEAPPPASSQNSIRTVVGGSRSAAPPRGLVTSTASGAAPGPQQMLFGQSPGTQVLVQGDLAGASGAFEPILQREVDYPPLPEGGEVMMDLMGPKSVAELMEDIRIATMWNILISDEVRGRVLEFAINSATPQDAMEILKFNDIYYEFDPETKYLYVMSVEEWQRREYGKIEAHKFVLEHADNGTIEPLLATLLSSVGRMIADARTRQIYVWDTPDNIAQMAKTVAELDVPLKKREFAVEFADFPDMEAALTSMLSPAGSLLPDSRTNKIIAWDQPDVLDRMADALVTLDIPVTSQTFYLAHVPADDMVDYLEVMVSERGIIQVDPRYNAIVVTDLPGVLTKITELLETIDKELDTRTWVIDYADLEFLAEQIETKIPAEMGEIVVQEDVHQITVSGIPSRLDEIDKLIKAWDIQRKQVQIEAFIVEVGSDVEREFNINWSYFGSQGESPIFYNGGSGFNPDGGNLNIGQLPYTVPLYGALQLDDAGQIVRPLVTNTAGENVIDRVAGNNLAVTLQYLDQENKATVLSSPRVAVQDGEEASFSNATQVPYVSATTFFNNSNISSFGNTNNTNRVEFIDVGTILRVLPRITTKNNILLDISAEDSTFVEVRVLASDQASTVPQKTERKAETQLRIQSGDTVVLGGLRRDRAGKTETRTPILGDLPGIGRLFRYPNKRSENSSLLIFITPTIVDEFTDPHAAILATAEENIAEEHRHNQKGLWGRIGDTVSKNKNEINIAVGQSGDIHAEGERASLDDVRVLFEDAPANVTVVLRRHPRAPAEMVTAVTEIALELERKLEFDENSVPLVPRYPQKMESGVPPEAAKLVPSAPTE